MCGLPQLDRFISRGRNNNVLIFLQRAYRIYRLRMCHDSSNELNLIVLDASYLYLPVPAPRIKYRKLFVAYINSSLL